MPFARSFYADQKPAEKPQAAPPVSAVPAVTPIAEDALSPTQIQEAIRLYRSVISNSAPSSPVQHAQPEQVAEPEKPCVYSNYYGGGPTDIPQSYMVNYASSPRSKSSAAPPPPPVAPVEAPPAPVEPVPEQLVESLQNLSIQTQKPAARRPEPVNNNPMMTRMYDDEESGYCFNKPKEENVVEQQYFVEHETEQEEPAQPTPTAPVEQEHVAPKYIPAPQVAQKYQATGPSEYIGMSNDCKFIYDGRNSLPPSYSANAHYTLVSNSPQPVVQQQQQVEREPEHGTTTTEDITQVPASPAAPQSRFRGLIKNVASPAPANPNGPIVVERVAEQSAHYNYGGAFAPVNFANMESEYQLPVLNDLASCIENY